MTGSHERYNEADDSVDASSLDGGKTAQLGYRVRPKDKEMLKQFTLYKNDGVFQGRAGDVVVAAIHLYIAEYFWRNIEELEAFRESEYTDVTPPDVGLIKDWMAETAMDTLSAAQGIQLSQTPPRNRGDSYHDFVSSRGRFQSTERGPPERGSGFGHEANVDAQPSQIRDSLANLGGATDPDTVEHPQDPGEMEKSAREIEELHDKIVELAEATKEVEKEEKEMKSEVEELRDELREVANKTANLEEEVGKLAAETEG